MTAPERHVPDHGDLLLHLRNSKRETYGAELLGLLFTLPGITHLADTLERRVDGAFEEQVAWWNTLQIAHDGSGVTLSSKHGTASGPTEDVVALIRSLAPRVERASPKGVTTLPQGTSDLALEDRVLLAAFALSDAQVQFIRPGLLLGAKYDACYWQTDSLNRMPRGQGTAAALLAAT